MINRRLFIIGLVTPFFLRWRDALGRETSFENLLALLEKDNSRFPGAGGRIEGKAFETSAFAAAQPKVGKSNRRISSEAIQMITAFEVSGKKTYEAKYRRPIWPEGASGVTFAIGYDLGYVNAKEFDEDWRDYMIPEDRQRLTPVLGIKGVAAKRALPQVQSINVPFSLAHNQFTGQTLKKYIALAETSLPNTDRLSDGAMGALVSLTFNRGASYRVRADEDPTGRYKEMREIRRLMREEKYHDIPQQIRNMKRLWQGDPKMSGLLSRRDMEASLFEASL